MVYRIDTDDDEQRDPPDDHGKDRVLYTKVCYKKDNGDDLKQYEQCRKGNPSDTVLNGSFFLSGPLLHLNLLDVLDESLVTKIEEIQIDLRDDFYRCVH